MSINKKKSKTVTEAEIRKREKKLADEIIFKYQLLSMWVLRKDYGYGEKRLLRFLNGLSDVADDITARRITFDDIITAIESETGMKISE